MTSSTYSRSFFLASLALACSLVAAKEPEACPSGSGHSVEDAKALFRGWLGSSSIPGKYSSAKERLENSEHQGDLTNNIIFSEGYCGPRDRNCHGGSAQWPHTKANPLYTLDNDEWETNREDMVAASAWLLWRGMSRLQDAVFEMLPEVSPREIDDVMLLARRALNSFEDFWRQLSWTVAYGERQVEWRVAEEMKEYGPDTNFWLKFRPTLSCHHSPRLGPELGGAKAWCNEAFHKPKTVLSLGSGDDFTYEHLVVEKWPGVTIVTADCFQFEKAVTRSFEEGMGRMVVLPVCLTGESREYADLQPPHLADKFVTFPALVKEVRDKHGVDHFDLVKANIEASEYTVFAHVFRDPDANLGGTAQINMEVHRMGMHDYLAQKGFSGRDFNSLLFLNLLFAHFLSGGFHPVFTEKWHDTNAAQDVVFVNQTWWLWSELQYKHQLWTLPFPDPPLSTSSSPAFASYLAQEHAGGRDPFRAPGGTMTKREERAGKGKDGKKKKKKDKATRTQTRTTTTTAEPPDMVIDIGDPSGSSGGFAAPPQASQGAVQTLDAKGLAKLMEGGPGFVPSFVMLELPTSTGSDCKDCGAMRAFWNMVGQNFANVWHVRCQDADPTVCPNIVGASQPDANPLFFTWDGEEFELYAGAKSPDALVQSMRAAVARAGLLGAQQQQRRKEKRRKDTRSRKQQREDEMAAMFDMRASAGSHGQPLRKSDGPGRWEPMPVESSEISVADFVRRFVEPGIPVVLRAPAKAKTKHGPSRSGTEWLRWLGTHCGEGKVHVFRPEPEGTGWAGFGQSEQVPLKQLTDQLLTEGNADKPDASSFVYGFDFRTRCDCAQLLDEVEILPHFLADRLGTDPALPRTNWPALLVGPPGSTSALHVDAKFLPFWLSLYSGRKTFRVVTLDDWREHLAGPGSLFAHDGTVQRPVDAFDDAEVERELLARGATVYNISLQPGDTLYLPVGALHGAFNAAGAGPAVALTANFLDADHGPVVDEEYCEEVPNAAQTDAVCNLLARDPTLRSGQVRLPPRPGKPQPFWQWHLSDAVRGGFCAKYGAREARCAGAAQRCEAAAEGDGMISAFRSAFAAQQTAAST